MTSVTFSTTLGGDGSIVSDDTNADTGLRNGGHRTRFVAALVQFVAMCSYAKTQATAAAAAALSALNAATTNATSPTSLSLADTGDISLTLAQAGKEFTVGMTIGIARTSDPVKQMIGVVKTFVSATGVMTATMQSKTDTAGPFTDWTVFRTAAGGIPATRAVAAAGLATGGGTLAADMTVTVTAATAAQAAAGTSTSVALTPGAQADSYKPSTLTYAASMAPDFAAKKTTQVTMTGNGAMAVPTGYIDGNFYAIEIIQDGTGSQTLSWDAAYDFGIDGVPVLSTGAGKVDTVYLHCIDAVTPKFRCSFKQAA